MTSLEARRPLLAWPRRRLVPDFLLRHFVLIILLVAMLYPVAWMLFSAFGRSDEIFVRIGLLPNHWTWSNFVQGWHPAPGVSFTRLYFNTLVISCLAVVGNVLSCTVAAYAFARLQFRFKAALFGLMLLTIMLPHQVLIVPQYILFQKLGWLNTYLPLVVPRFLAVDSFFIFLMVQFIRGISRELDEAAIIDGANHFQIFGRIIVPLALPAMATTALFTFLERWNDFLGPLLYLTKPSMYTVPQGLNLFLDDSSTSLWGPLFAMCVLSLGPVIGVFFATQNLLTEGIATTGMK